ncbi:MAG: glycoside hydrolase family 3 protein [Alphaproteobacteria bacterium]|nr:glycoside hydrolase family 3 protein [Alphaproteobacteria bacterium]
MSSEPGGDRQARRPRAILFGCAGETLSADERAFFRDADPLGFILFQRNCREPQQVRALLDAMRDCVGRTDAPVLIDQEGGRVARLKPPHWRVYPSAARLALLGNAEEAVRLGARLIADDLGGVGVTVDAMPVLDLPVPGADDVIGDRAYGGGPGHTARLARAACEGLLAGGVLPIVKHMPGHGRARVDSHKAMPVVDDDAALLAATDFAPFTALADMPWAMTAHVVYRAIDRERPATLSPTVIATVIRGAIAFAGVLASDDIGMGALSGRIGDRVAGALAAGCDVVLHCSGKLGEMREAAAAAAPLTAAATARLARAEALRLGSRRPFDRRDAEDRFDRLTGAAGTSAG